MKLVQQLRKIPFVDFDLIEAEVYAYQLQNNPVFASWHQHLQPPAFRHFLPVEMFKTHRVVSGYGVAETYFTSSGTTLQQKSVHWITDLSLYRHAALECFKLAYGDPRQYRILCLLPSYMESGNSSLIHMCRLLIESSEHPQGGFYHHKTSELIDLLQQEDSRTTLLVGVTYALLDLAEKHPMPLINTMVMETGGMKGRRKELIREEVHTILEQAFQLPLIHSEYGMTELFSQAYSLGKGIYRCPPWMKVFIRDADDPFTLLPPGKSGLISIIDLMNIHSCSYLATQDVGVVFEDGSFQVTGRSDNSDLRGCNLMIQ